MSMNFPVRVANTSRIQSIAMTKLLIKVFGARLYIFKVYADLKQKKIEVKVNA